jgi:pimeloyl-ACP methyl ester carboxylesterase
LQRGLWRDDDGAFAIGRFSEFGDSDFGFDYAALRVGALVDRTEGSASISSALNGAGPAIASLIAENAFLRVGTRRLQPVAIDRRAFEAHAPGAKLSAELATPIGSKPRGTMLMIYGSGPAPKEAFDPWAFWFLAQGFAVLTYDKRGSGRSTGDWRVSGLEALAEDAKAALSAAKAIGLSGPVFGWGASQAGWVLPQLGAAGLLDGFIMHAGSAMRPGEQILAQVEAELRAYGFPQEEIDRARAYYALDTDVSRGARPWDEVKAAYDAASASGAEWLLAPPAAPDAPERTMIRLMADFDPEPYWRGNRAPVLALFGAKDWVVPAEENLAALKGMTAPGADIATRIIPKANHLMFESDTGLRDEYPTRSRIVPQYFAEIERWLSAHAGPIESAGANR